jgi:hypothetical protein
MPAAAAAGAVETGRAFAAAYAAGDEEQLRRLLHPRVHEREIVPGAVVEPRRAETTIEELRAFRAAWEGIEVLVNEARPVGDLVRWSARWRVHRDARVGIVEFHALLGIQGGRIRTLDAVCSGVRPES